MADVRTQLREWIAGGLHETRGLLAEETLLFEDCLTLADAVLALGEIRALGRVDRGVHWVDALLVDLDPTHVVAELRLQLPPVPVDDEESPIDA